MYGSALYIVCQTYLDVLEGVLKCWSMKVRSTMCCDVDRLDVCFGNGQ